MSTDSRRTGRVLAIIRQLAESSPDGFRPGDVNARLREAGDPLGAWEVRGELSLLEARGALTYDPEQAIWRLRPEA